MSFVLGVLVLICCDQMRWGCRVVATNVFEKQHGQWKIIHHHGSPAPLFV